MKLKIKELDKFKKAIAFLSGMATEVVFNFKDTTVEMYVNNSSVSMSRITLDKGIFDECEGTGLMQIYLTDLNKTLKILKGTATIDDEQGSLNITDGRAKYNLPIIDGGEQPSIAFPNIPYEHHFTLKLSELKEGLNAMNAVGDGNLMIRMNTTGVSVSTTSGIKRGELPLSTTGISGDITATYSQRLFTPLNAFPDEQLTLRMGQDYPLMIELVQPLIKYEFIIAPTVGD